MTIYAGRRLAEIYLGILAVSISAPIVK